MDPTARESSAKPESPPVAPFERHFPAGACVFDEGDPGRSLFVIQSGQVELTRCGADGNRLVARLGPGEFFGEMSVLLGQSRGERAVAVGEADLLEISGATFESMCIDQPEIAIRVIQRLASRVIDLETRLAALGVDDLLRPVVRVLLRAATPADSEHRVALGLREIAERAGLAMIEVHRALAPLFDRKLIRLHEDVLYIPSLEDLSASLD